jgi:DNA-binding transcriptional ArsR family regulator
MAETEQADALFHALADPTRRDILAVVLQEAHSVSDLARHYPISFAAVHKHVGSLPYAASAWRGGQGRLTPCGN